MALWGPDKNLDFHSALRLGHVDKAEARAVELLEEVCDPYRASIYLYRGVFPAMGNVTKRMYLVRRKSPHTEVIECEAGRPIKSYCISIAMGILVPPTDAVIALKNLIEGEELSFRRTGNATEGSGWWPQHRSPMESEAFLVPHIDADFEDLHRGWGIPPDARWQMDDVDLVDFERPEREHKFHRNVRYRPSRKAKAACRRRDKRLKAAAKYMQKFSGELPEPEKPQVNIQQFGWTTAGDYYAGPTDNSVTGNNGITFDTNDSMFVQGVRMGIQDRIEEQLNLDERFGPIVGSTDPRVQAQAERFLEEDPFMRENFEHIGGGWSRMRREGEPFDRDGRTHEPIPDENYINHLRGLVRERMAEDL